MSALNDRDLMTYALREALAREKNITVKLQAYLRFTRDLKLKKLCSELIINSQSRINILQSEMTNLYVKQE